VIGQTISHYRITGKLGEGGMGVVYRAHDKSRLDRDVALKVLPQEVTQDAERLARFDLEANLLASLKHPNIVTIYSVEEADGVHFLTMELVEGETLSEIVAARGLPLDRFFDLAIALADAVNSAHGRGIVHRDLKPANIMVDEEGRLKVLDFGLAKLCEPGVGTGVPDDERTMAMTESPTVAGSILGTPDYMSPFKGGSPASTVSAILRDTPSSLTDLRPELPRHLERIVSHCLAKETDRRYQSALDLRNDLEGLKRETWSALQGKGNDQIVEDRGTPRGTRRLRIVGLAIVAVAALALGYWQLRPGREAPATAGGPARKMIVVLPFENLGPAEEEYFSDGITGAITTRLAGFKDLGVISRQSASQYKGTDKSIRQIGDELGVDYVLEGTIQREKPGDPASRVRVNPQLVRVADDTNIWAMLYENDMVEVFRVQSEIADSVAKQLDIALLRPKGPKGGKRPTENLEAYDAYLRGQEYVNNYQFSSDPSEIDTAVELLQRAVSLDPGFAEAWAELSRAYREMHWATGKPEILPLLEEAASRAQDLAPDLPETHMALGCDDYVNLRYDQALEHFEAARNARPNAEILLYNGAALRRLGRWEEALARFEEAHRLAPRDYSIQYDGLGNTLSLMGRFEEAKRHYDRAISLTPDVPDAYLDMAYFLMTSTGDVGAAKRVLRTMAERTDLTQVALTAQGQVFVPAIRIFPETYSEAFDAFDAGPVERFSRKRPALIAWVHLAQALLAETRGDSRTAHARYDSARVHYERVIRSDLLSAYICIYHANLGLAYAGLGRGEDAIRHGKEAVRLLPPTKDAVMGNDLGRNLAEIHLKCDEPDAAIDLLETLLRVSPIVTPELLRVDPVWDPLRKDPRFQALVEGS